MTIKTIPDPYSEEIYVDKCCSCNEYKAMHNRHLLTNAERYIQDSQMISDAFEYVYRDYPPVHNLQRLTMQQVVDRKPQSKRKLYLNAMHSLSADPALHPRDHRADMFVKRERKSDPTKAPRAIQGFSPRYNLLYQTYLLPIEQHFKNMGYSKQLMTKGMDQIKQAKFIKTISDDFDQPCYILADHSRYDSRQHVGWLEAEARYSQSFYPGDDQFQYLCEKQIGVNHGVSKQGTNYTVSGTRMSGVPNTSFGNSIINFAILSYWLNSCGITKYRIVVNGDDSIILINAHDQSKLDPVKLSELGFGTTYDVVHELHDVSFCQTQPITTANGSIMVRTPSRVITRCLTCIDPGVDLRLLPHWYHSVGLCELSLNAGVPILQSFAKFLIRCGSRVITTNENSEYRAIKTPQRHHITEQARIEFYRAFGHTITQQIDMEKHFDNKVVDFRTIQI